MGDAGEEEFFCEVKFVYNRASQLNARSQLNASFNLYANLRISNHNQTFSEALNVVLAFSYPVLSICKRGFHFFPSL